MVGEIVKRNTTVVVNKEKSVSLTDMRQVAVELFSICWTSWKYRLWVETKSAWRKGRMFGNRRFNIREEDMSESNCNIEKQLQYRKTAAVWKGYSTRKVLVSGKQCER